MADREKVIKGLECCLSGGNADACEECPYKVPCHATVGKGTISPLLEDAIELLKEQSIAYEEAFSTIRDAYHSTEENREKLLEQYLMKNACCYKSPNQSTEDDTGFGGLMSAT